MATSPNYGWLEPDNTDLVKNGALAIRTLGNAIDTTMATMTPKSTVTTKGDLVAATAASTPARLAVGNNGETLVADSSTSTGLRYQGSQAAGKNAIINGNFDIWQRGTSFASPANYFADRWTSNGGAAFITFSQQSSGAPNGSRYYLRATSTAGGSYSDICQYIETANAEQYWGKTVTVSIKMRRNATVNNSGFVLKLDKSSTVDGGVGATWTTIQQTITPLASIPTGTTSADWYTASVTASVPNDGTANSLRVLVQYNGATANASVLDLSQAMLEIGSVPTEFTRAGGTIQGELAACQRYFYRYNAAGTTGPLGVGNYYSSTLIVIGVQMKQTMRTTPSATFNNPTNFTVYSNGAARAATSMSLDIANADLYSVTVTTSAATAGNAGSANAVQTNASIDFSSEL